MIMNVINTSTCMNTNGEHLEDDKPAMIVFWYSSASAVSVILATLGFNMFWRKSFVLFRDIPFVVLFEILAMAIFQIGCKRFTCQQYLVPGLLGFDLILYKSISKVMS